MKVLLITLIRPSKAYFHLKAKKGLMLALPAIALAGDLLERQLGHLCKGFYVQPMGHALQVLYSAPLSG